MKLYLIGYMGCGKSVTGKKLSFLLKLPFIDLDKIVAVAGGMSIPDIFRKKGEIFFRELERKCLKKILKRKSGVIATGGGTPCYYDNMELMKENGLTCYIRLGADKLISRIVSKPAKRPLLKGLSRKRIESYIRMMLPEREKFYMKAKYVVDADDKSVNEVCREIVHYI